MDRPNLRPLCRLLVVVVLLTAVISAGGCSALTMAMYLFGGMNTPAEFDGLREKRVVVVCRPLVEMQYRNTNAAKDIAREVGNQLRNHVWKIKVVDHRKVDQWVDEQSWDDEYSQIGKSLEADMVLAIDLLHFDIYKGQTLYQGKANYSMRVVDCETGTAVYEAIPDPVAWPPSAGGIPTSEKQESQFRREFVKVMADQIARYFYAHDPRDHFAEDSTAFD